MLSTQADNCIPFVHIFAIISSFPAEMEEPKVGISDKGLTEPISCHSWAWIHIWRKVFSNIST